MISTGGALSTLVVYICAAAKTPSSHLHSRSRAYPFNAKGSLKSSAIHSISLFCKVRFRLVLYARECTDIPLRSFARAPGVLDFGLDGGVPPGPRDPNPCLEVQKVPKFRDFAQKMDPCLGIF